MRTSLYSVLCIVIRIGAILLATNIVAAFPAAYLAASNGHFGAGASASLIGFSGALLSIAALFWIFPGILARFAAGQASRQVFESPIGVRELQYIAFAVLGTAFAMNGLIDLVAVGMRAALISNLHDPAFENVHREDWIKIATLGLKLLLGVALLLGSDGLVGLLHRLRETGLRPASIADTQDEDAAERD